MKPEPSKLNFFIDFENTSPETHANILAALQAELDEAKGEKRIPRWDKALASLAPHSQNTMTH